MSIRVQFLAAAAALCGALAAQTTADRKSTRLNSSHSQISYAVFCLKKKKPDVVIGIGSAHARPPGTVHTRMPSSACTDLTPPPRQRDSHDITIFSTYR